MQQNRNEKPKDNEVNESFIIERFNLLIDKNLNSKHRNWNRRDTWFWYNTEKQSS